MSTMIVNVTPTGVMASVALPPAPPPTATPANGVAPSPPALAPQAQTVAPAAAPLNTNDRLLSQTMMVAIQTDTADGSASAAEAAVLSAAAAAYSSNAA